MIRYGYYNHNCIVLRAMDDIILKQQLKGREFAQSRFGMCKYGPFVPRRCENNCVLLRKLRGRSMNSKTAEYPRFRLFTPNPPAFFAWGVR